VKLIYVWTFPFYFTYRWWKNSFSFKGLIFLTIYVFPPFFTFSHTNCSHFELFNCFGSIEDFIIKINSFWKLRVPKLFSWTRNVFLKRSNDGYGKFGAILIFDSIESLFIRICYRWVMWQFCKTQTWKGIFVQKYATSPQLLSLRYLSASWCISIFVFRRLIHYFGMKIA